MQNAVFVREHFPSEQSGVEWVTVSEAARYYRVSRNTIYQACQEGELEHTRIRTAMRIPVNINENYLTVAEVARILKVSPSTVYEACALKEGTGVIEHIRIRSRIRIPASRLCNPSGGIELR